MNVNKTVTFSLMRVLGCPAHKKNGGVVKRALFAGTAVLLLQGCESMSKCEQWETQPVIEQVCIRSSGGVCAHYETRYSSRRSCVKWGENGGEGESASSARREVDSPLMAAVRRGDTKEVEHLLTKGADVNEWVPGNTFKSPLTFAVSANDLDMVKTLLKHKADPNKRGCTKGDDAVYALYQRPPLHIAVGCWTACWNKTEIARKVEITRLLIAAGAKLNGLDCDGRTALHEGALSCSVETSRILIERGANVNAVAKFGDTPLGSALFEYGERDSPYLKARCKQVADLLKRAGAVE